MQGNYAKSETGDFSLAKPGARIVLCRVQQLLPFKRGGGMQVTDSDGKRVRSIHGLRRRRQAEQTCDHVLHLLLLGAAIADHRRFDGEWRIFRNLQSRGGGGQHGHTANLPQFQSRLHVQGVEHIFDGNLIRPVLGDNLAQLVEDAGQTPRERFVR